MKKTLIILSLPLFLMACRPEIDEAKVAKIDSLQQVLDSSQQKISVMDSAKMMDYAHHYFENLDYFKNEFSDTIDTETAFYIDKYYGMRKAMKLMQKKYNTNVEELRINKQQLENLKHDAKEGLLEEQQFDKYINLEYQNVSQLRSAINRISRAYDYNIPLYEEMNTRVDSIISEDKKKAKGEES